MVSYLLPDLTGYDWHTNFTNNSLADYGIYWILLSDCLDQCLSSITTKKLRCDYAKIRKNLNIEYCVISQYCEDDDHLVVN